MAITKLDDAKRVAEQNYNDTPNVSTGPQQQDQSQQQAGGWDFQGQQNTEIAPVSTFEPGSIEESIHQNLLQNDPNYVPPVEEFNPYVTDAPQSVVDAQNQYNQINIATQEYADEMTARIIADRNGYMTDDNYQGMMNRTLTDQAYNYIKRANHGADDSAWEKPNPNDDLYTKYLPEIISDQEIRKQASEQMKKQTPTKEERMVQSIYNRSNSAQQAVMDAGDMEHGSWYLMSPLEKAKYLIVPGSNQTTMDNAPEWTKFITNIAPSVMAGSAGAMLGSLIPIPGAGAVAGLAVGGLTYLQGVTGIQIPIISEVLNAIDLGEKVEPFFTGGISAISKAYEKNHGDTPLLETIKNGDLDIINLAVTAAEVMKDPKNKYLWEVSKYGYEVGADAMDDILRTVRNAGAAVSDKVFGTEFGQRDASQVSRANIGRSGLENLVEGTYGADSLIDTYLPLFTDFVETAMKNGMDEKAAIEFAHQNFQNYILNYTGTTGLVNDLAAQSVVDPANIAPFFTAKAAEGLGKITGDTALQNAGKAAGGNLLIDILPQPFQQGAEILTGKHGSQGFDVIKQVYGEGIRGTMDVNTLSGIQRHIAGLDKEGIIKDVKPNVSSGNVVLDWMKNLFKTTNETKMYDVTQMSSDFLGSVIFNSDTKSYMIPDMIEQIAGRKPITPDSPLAAFQNTAIFKTLQEAYSQVDNATLKQITQDVQNYRQYGKNRAVVDHVAQELGMSPDEIFNALDNKNINEKDPKYARMTKDERKAALDSDRQKLFDQIRQKEITFTDSDGKVLNTNKVIETINVFKEPKGGGNTVGRRQYSDTYLKASIMENIANTVDNYNLAKYNIQPDSWAVRTSNLAKSMQSIALLNFSTSYQVNNFLNNMLTRSVVGVGGINHKVLNDVVKARGLSFTREGDTYQATGRKIKEAKKANDTLQRINDMYQKATDNHLFKGVNNLDIEGMETNAAFNIGTNRYWDATWGANIPEIPQAWKALGITDDMNQAIFKLALDSPNLEVFREKLMGDVVLPKAASTLAQMLENSYDTESAKIIRDFISTKPWIQEMVDSFMETGDERLIRRGFDELIDRLTNDVNLQNVTQLESTFDDLRNTYAGEGIGAVATAFEALNDLYTQIWIKQTKENGTLFLDRVAQMIDNDTFEKRYEAQTKTQMNDYKIARGYTIMNIAAMIEGLGMDTDTGLSLLNNAMQLYDLGEEYIKIDHQIHEKYGVRTSPNFDFEKFRADKIEACSRTLEAQLEASKALNKTMVDYLRNNLDQSWTGHIDNFEQALNEVIKLKEAENKAEIKDLERRINKDGKKGREKVSIKQEKPRIQRKQEIHNAYEQAAKSLKQMESAIQAKPTPAGPSSLEATLKMELLYEEGKNMANHAGDFLKKYKDGDNPATVYEPMNFENKNVKTTFVEYGKQMIAERAAAEGLDPMIESAKIAADFIYNGDAVNLGSVDATQPTNYFDPATGAFVQHPVLDHFQLVNPDADIKVPGSKFSMARSEPYLYGGNIVNAGVYYQGKLIAYITQGMNQSITVDGKTYPVIGISPNNPNTVVLYVGNKVREVTPGKPKNVEFSVYAKDNFHPSGIGTTPTIEPWGKVALESSFGIRDAVNRWRDQAISDLHKAQKNGSLFGKLNDAQRQAVFEYMDGDLRQAYNAQRYMTQRYGETMVDAALLNYNKRYGFDNTLTMLCPYQYWMTRSLANWGKRMVSQPAWFSMYARLQKLIEKNKKDFLPTRLEGLVGIPMPNMGDGMGDSWFFDIMNTIFPFQQFYNITDYFEKNLNTIHQNTLTKIDEMWENGETFNGQEITDEMYDEAKQGKGDLYWTIFRAEQANDESDTTTSGLLGTFFSPPVWFDMVRKHLAGKDKDISYSPMFRMGNMIKAAGDDTFMEEFTDLIGGAMQLPENAIRGVMGIESNPDGNYADYGIVSNIANMLTANEISENEALNAIAEGEGNRIYDQALYRYRQSQAQRMQGGALLTEIGQSLGGNKTTSAGQLAGTALASIFGAKTYSEGERMHREHQATYRDIVKNLDKKSDAYKQFWKDHPDYSVHSYAYEDDPEKRLHRVLVDNLENAYYALDYSQQDAVERALGSRFTTLFVNKETKATDYLDNDEIIQWTRAMQGNVPNLDDGAINRSMEEAQQIKWYADSVLGDYDRYIRDRDKQFPGITEVQSGYYEVPKNMRNQYLIENPMLQDYWDWNDKVIRANPRLQTFINDKGAAGQVYYGKYDTITDALMSKLNDWTMKQLQNHIDYGWAIKPEAERTLKSVYQSLQTNVPYDTWLQSLAK